MLINIGFCYQRRDGVKYKNTNAETIRDLLGTIREKLGNWH